MDYVEIGEICEIKRGRVISKEDIQSDGIYPVYSSQTVNNGELGKISTYDFDGEYITWTTDGANAGTAFYRNGKFSITNVCGLISINKPEIDIKYVYYYLNKVMKSYVSSGMGNPKLMSNVVKKIKIALPALEKQQKIVDLLDRYTKSNDELIDNLNKEYELRCKQYEYYRDELLDSLNEVNILKLSELCEIIVGGDILKDRFESFKTEKYNIPVISNGTGEKAIMGFTDDARVKGESITISARGTIGNVEYRNYDYYPIVRLLCLKVKNDVLISKYLYYYLKKNKFVHVKTGIPSLTSKMIMDISIKIPSLEKQMEIVNILEKYESMYNEVREKILAEIEMREKQYEHYRDLLLSF